MEWQFTDINTIADGQKLLQRLMVMKKRPDAVIAGSDQVAAGIIAEAQTMQLKVPEDLAVLGFDDQPLSRVVARPLTTIHQPVHEIGDRIANMVADALEGKSIEVKEVVLPLSGCSAVGLEFLFNQNWYQYQKMEEIKMTVVLARVDQRLVHGIVVNQWSAEVQPKRYMVIDDVVSQDENVKASMRLSKPAGTGCQLSILKRP